MRKMLFTTLSLFLSILIAGSASVNAAPLAPIVISKLQTGGASKNTASHEAIELSNLTQEDIKIDDWCLKYSSKKGVTSRVLACFTAPEGLDLYLKPAGSILLVSKSHPLARDSTVDAVFADGLAGAAGHIWLENEAGEYIDRIGYGAGAVRPEGASAPAPKGGQVLMRIEHEGLPQDTDHNGADFILIAEPLFVGGGLYEAAEPVDACNNMEGIQQWLPDGYGVNDDGTCLRDICLNLEELQENVPKGYVKADEAGDCIEIQLESAALQISELLPNPAGTDNSHEFIEVYNPLERAVSLKGYQFMTGLAYDRRIVIEADIIIQPRSYAVITQQELNFTLTNVASRVKLISPSGNTVSETDSYSSPPEGQSWASVDDVWQFTSVPTPGAGNYKLASHNAVEAGVVDEERHTEEPAPCPAGKYRHPETNRCRNNEVALSVARPCEVGEYRHATTNRCRSLNAASVADLVPCAPGQERNLETNRCRKTGEVQSVAELKPCAVNQERNPETNRCRKITSSPITTPAAVSAKAAVEPQAASSAGHNLQWLAVGALSIGALGFGLYEWRSEISAGFSRLRGSRRP